MTTGYFKNCRCTRCYDLGAWLTPKGIVTECPNLQLKLADHPEPNDAAKAILRAGRQLAYRGIVANPIAFSVARRLAKATTADPVDRETLIDTYFEYARSQKVRHLHETIEQLRSLWLLPVGSRKSQPYGYWIITDEADFKDWVKRSTSAPIKQLTTIHAVARANFPVFAEQLDFEFWKDMAEQYSPAETVSAMSG